MGLLCLCVDCLEAEEGDFEGREELRLSVFPFAYNANDAKRNITAITIHFFLLCVFMTIPFLRTVLRPFLRIGS